MGQNLLKMEQKEDVTQVLNDLLKINNDHMLEYKKATKQIVDFEWTNLFLSLIDESKKFGQELAAAILQRGGVPQLNAMTSYGKIYQFWMEIKDAFSGMDKASIFNKYEFLEEGALQAYKRALEYEILSPELKSMILRQYDNQTSSQSTINYDRDTAVLNLYNGAF